MMANLPKENILLFHPNTVLEVRKEVEIDAPGRVEEALLLLEEWIKKQAHFVRKDFSRQYLERTLVISKGSIERAKEKIDKKCTIRTLKPDIFNVIDIKADLLTMKEKFSFAVLPKLTENHHRVIVYQILSSDFNTDDLRMCFKLGCVLGEYLTEVDYCNGFIFIADHLQVKNLLSLLTKLNPMVWGELTKLIIDLYGLRVKKFLFLSESNVVEKFVNVFKQFISEKIASRLEVVKSSTDLYVHISKDVLPEDYGGQERSIEKLNEEWTDLLSSSENMEYYNEMKQFKTDEAFRQTDKFNEVYMGMPGSFRAMSVD